MSRVCVLSGKRPKRGHNVSHSNRKTKRIFSTNLHNHRIWLPVQKRFVKLRLSAYGLRLIDKLGAEKALLKITKQLVAR